MPRESSGQLFVKVTGSSGVLNTLRGALSLEPGTKTVVEAEPRVTRADGEIAAIEEEGRGQILAQVYPTEASFSEASNELVLVCG